MALELQPTPPIQLSIMEALSQMGAPKKMGVSLPQLPINAYNVFLAGAGHQVCVAEAEFQVRVDKRSRYLFPPRPTQRAKTLPQVQ